MYHSVAGQGKNNIKIVEGIKFPNNNVTRDPDILLSSVSSLTRPYVSNETVLFLDFGWGGDKIQIDEVYIDSVTNKLDK